MLRPCISRTGGELCAAPIRRANVRSPIRSAEVSLSFGAKVAIRCGPRWNRQPSPYMSNRHLMNEVIARWNDLPIAEVEASHGDREGLVELLSAHYGFNRNCAEREIDTLLKHFAERLHRALAA
jgi:hypothetical protein